MTAFERFGGRESIVAVVDVSAGFAAVAILSVPKKGPARVLASGHSALALDEHTDAQHLVGITQHIQTAGEAAVKIFTEAGHHDPITQTYVFVHAPWVTTHTMSSEKKHFDSEVRVTEALIGELAQSLIASTKSPGEVFEASVVRVALNGYPTAKPVGKYAHLLEVTSLVSTDEAGIRKIVEPAILKLFPVARITWRSFARALVTFFREVSPYGQYLAIDMRAEATNLLSYRFGELEQSVAPIGTASILAKLGGEPADTLSALRMLATDACSTEACERVQSAMTTAEPMLVKAFGEALGKIATPHRPSNDLLLVTHPDLEPWLSRFFSRIDFSQFTVTTLPFSVHTPSPIEADALVSGALPDMALTIDCALVNIELTE